MKRALISVTNKLHLDYLAPKLESMNYIIYSTGGTYKYLNKIIKNNDNIIPLARYTESPEILGGRVKTLHPKIFSGLLAKKNNEKHLDDMLFSNAKFFDTLVVNLYPFEDTIKNTDNEEEIIEQIDIGGHSLLRAGIKNYKFVSVLSCPFQYKDFIEGNKDNLQLAKEGIKNIMDYDIAINNWFNKDNIGVSYNKVNDLKYGLNPYMKPSSIYVKKDNIAPYNIINGNPGYINFLDANNAIKLAIEVKETLGLNCCASFKHNSPAGVSLFDRSSKITFLNTRNIDPKSSFGDFIGYSGLVDIDMANEIKKCVSDGIIASCYDNKSIKILKKKKNNNYIVMKQSYILKKEQEFRDVNGVTLVQPYNDCILTPEEIDETDGRFNDDIKRDMILGFITLKYTQSNSVCFIYQGKVIGIGAGQQNRVDCVRLAGDKAKEWLERNNIKDAELILVSDAFFPFSDNIDVANEYNVKYIAQPGGSVRDNEVEERCNKYGIKMYYTGKRVFMH